MTCGIYKITSPRGAIYVGSSKNIEQRFRGYRCKSCAKNQHKLRHSLLKHGHENHDFEIIMECEFSELFELESLIGVELEATSMENLNFMLPSSGSSPAIVSEATKLKMKESWKKRKLVMSDQDRNRIGKWCAENNKGVKLSAERVEKARLRVTGEGNPMFGKFGKLHPLFGKKHSKESRKNMSEGHMRRTRADGYIHINSKKVVDSSSGEVFNSAKDAARKYNMNYSTLRSMLQGANPNKTTLHYEELRIN